MFPGSPTEIAHSLAAFYGAPTASALLKELARRGISVEELSERSLRRYLKVSPRRLSSDPRSLRSHKAQFPLYQIGMRALSPIPTSLDFFYARFLRAKDESPERREAAAELTLAARRELSTSENLHKAGVHFTIGHGLLHLGAEISAECLEKEPTVRHTIATFGLSVDPDNCKQEVLKRAEDDFRLAGSLAQKHFNACAFPARCALGKLAARIQLGIATSEELRTGLAQAKTLVEANPHEIRAITTALYIAANISDEDAAVAFGRLLAKAGFKDLADPLPHGRAIADAICVHDQWILAVFRRHRIAKGTHLVLVDA